MSSTVQQHPKHTNRLAKETSPYLLQHQHNPVDWYAWGPDAFAAARRENKPIFVSVGYSTCYWCHVMERQSFENEAVAAEMNKRFINIKVDREERPDVDQLYMLAVQVLTQHGGWPMSVFLAPDLRPFYGGTYYPPERFVAVLRGIEDAFHNRPGDVIQHCTQLTDVLEQLAEPAAPQNVIRVDNAWIEHLVSRSVLDYEPHHGGFGSAPKLPRETLLEMLLVHNRHFPNPDRLKMVRHALVAMAEGGIRDQLGGGFHRYSTDAQWLVPHFEIMLYDNAMLGWVYTEAFRQTQDIQFANTARGIFDFVLREMTSPAGPFYTAFDAEVDAQEGLSYLWTQEEVQDILRGPMVAMPTPNARAVDKIQHEFPHEDVQLFLKTYGLDRGPNFADPHHGNGQPDKNILYLPRPLTVVAQDAGISVQQLEERLEPMRSRLYEARRNRKQPLLDTKIITSWNALMIRALAYGGKILQEDLYIDAAARATTFLHDHHRTSDGGLWRTSRDGVAKHDAFLDDYAFFIRALVALNDAGGETKWMEYARALAATMIERFGDIDEDSPNALPAGFYFTNETATDLIIRQKVGSDSPLPSGNAMAIIALLELGDSDSARSTLGTFAQALSASGEGMSAMVKAATLFLHVNEPFTVTAVTDDEAAARPPSPNSVAETVVTLRAEWANEKELQVHAKILDGFHINANNPGEGLIATRLELEGPARDAVESIDYPPGAEQSFAFADSPIRIYGGEIEFNVRFKQSMTGTAELALLLTYQACKEDACFPPVTKKMLVNVG